MEPLLGSFLWITFWFGLLAFWGYKCTLRYKEREMDLRAMGRLPQMASRQSNVELRRLSEELGRLRETTTEYDLTVERELKELRERILLLESKLCDAQIQPSAIPADSSGQLYAPYRKTVRETSDRPGIPLPLR